MIHYSFCLFWITFCSCLLNNCIIKLNERHRYSSATLVISSISIYIASIIVLSVVFSISLCGSINSNHSNNFEYRQYLVLCDGLVIYFGIIVLLTVLQLLLIQLHYSNYNSYPTIHSPPFKHSTFLSLWTPSFYSVHISLKVQFIELKCLLVTTIWIDTIVIIFLTFNYNFLYIDGFVSVLFQWTFY